MPSDPRFEIFDVTDQTFNRLKTEIGEEIIEAGSNIIPFFQYEEPSKIKPLHNEGSSFESEAMFMDMLSQETGPSYAIGIELRSDGSPYCRERDLYFASEGLGFGNHKIYVSPESPPTLVNHGYVEMARTGIFDLPTLIKNGGAEIITARQAEDVISMLAQLTLEDVDMDNVIDGSKGTDWFDA